MILAANFEKIFGQAGLLGQTLVLEIGRADLGSILGLAHGVADLTPEVGFPGCFERQRIERALQLWAVVPVPPVLAAVVPRFAEAREWVTEGATLSVGKILRAGLAHDGASFHEVLEILFDVLVVNIQLLFESVQFGIVEDLPPLAAQLGIRGLRHRPASSFFELVGRFLVDGRGRLRSGRMVFRPDHAARQD